MRSWLLLLVIFSMSNVHFVACGFEQELTNSSDQAAALGLMYEQFLDAVYSPEGFIRQQVVPVDSDETESSEVRSSEVVSSSSGYRERRSAAVTLRRVRRQERLLCLGNEFLTSFLTKLVDANRQNLKDWEPINMGDAVNIGIMDLKRGRAYGVANIFFQGQVNVDCEIDKTYVAVELPIGIRDIRIVYDYTMPLALYMVSGQAEIAVTLLGVNVTLYLARNRKLGNKPFVKKVVVWSTRGFNMNLNGAGPATAAMGLVFNLLGKVSPMVIEQFMSSLFITVGGKLLANSNLPL